jgi:hypothetical protein
MHWAFEYLNKLRLQRFKTSAALLGRCMVPLQVLYKEQHRKNTDANTYYDRDSNPPSQSLKYIRVATLCASQLYHRDAQPPLQSHLVKFAGPLLRNTDVYEGSLDYMATVIGNIWHTNFCKIRRLRYPRHSMELYYTDTNYSCILPTAFCVEAQY